MSISKYNKRTTIKYDPFPIFSMYGRKKTREKSSRKLKGFWVPQKNNFPINPAIIIKTIFLSQSFF